MSTAMLTLGDVEQELNAIDCAAEERYRRLGGLCRHYLHAIQRIVRLIERGASLDAQDIDELRADMGEDGRRIRHEHQRAWAETTAFVESSLQRLGVLHEIRRRLLSQRREIEPEADTLLPSPVEIDLPNGKASNGQKIFFQSRRVNEEVWGKVRLVAELDAPVLFLGESGTGKTMFAKALRKHSNRADKPFVALNCATLQDQLLENELFGHERGAYTGADRLAKGKIDEAENGIFFLDEIGEMSGAVQSKILTLLEDGTFYRLGGNTPQHANVRFLFGTHRHLPTLIQEGKFREDLFYRIETSTVRMPRWDERADSVLIASRLLAKRAPKATIADEAAHLLAGTRLPGNIRQAENAVYKAWLLAMQDFRARKPNAPLDSAVLITADHMRTVLDEYEADRRQAQRSRTPDTGGGTLHA